MALPPMWQVVDGPFAPAGRRASCPMERARDQMGRTRRSRYERASNSADQRHRTTNARGLTLQALRLAMALETTGRHNQR
jgi:hypothetical protein